jgi:uncharacterized phage-associated protein
MAHSSLAIANEFIQRGLRGDTPPLTHMQIQKLIYLAHGWNLGANGQPLIEDPIEAWKFGPVIRKVYSALSKYGDAPVKRPIHWGDDNILYRGGDGGLAVEELSNAEKEIIELCWQSFGELPAFKLSALTHQPGTPWSETFALGANRVIPNELIEAHFRQSLAA